MRFVPATISVALLANEILAHPHKNPRKGLATRAVDFSAFQLNTKSHYSNAANTSDIGESITTSSFAENPQVEIATALVQKVFPEAQFRVVEDFYTGTNGVTHVNFKQTIHGLDIDNADFNVNVSIAICRYPPFRFWAVYRAVRIY